MKKTSFIIILLLTLIPYQKAMAHKKYPGAIITLEDDTVYGTVYYADRVHFQNGFKFKADSDGNNEFYRPKMLKGVYFYTSTDTFIYESRPEINSLPIMNGTFLLLQFNDCVKLYYYIQRRYGNSINVDIPSHQIPLRNLLHKCHNQCKGNR